MAGVRISFAELLLLKGLSVAKFPFKDEQGVEWSLASEASRFLGKQSLPKALKAAVENGLIITDEAASDDASKTAIRFTPLGAKLFKAAEPEFVKANKVRLEDQET